jgi:hypothetical protein
MKTIPIGYSDFKQLRENDFYYIDKSLLIKEVIEDGGQVLLLPRPRRFGKTLNLTMLRYFFEKVKDAAGTKALFSGLAIKNEHVFEKHCCKYPVIYLTFKDVKSLRFEQAIESIKLLISREFRRHDYLLDSQILNSSEKTIYNKIMNLEANISFYKESLLNLSTYLYRYYEEKPVILIDEYDTPIHTAYSENYYKEMIAFLRGFLGAGFKDNTNIFKGVLTGILRVARESIFSGMNNLNVYTLLRPEFNDKFGLTEPEIEKLLIDHQIEEKFDEIKYWYNGYIFGDIVIYNPWSILNYASSRDKLPRNYWANTSSNQIIRYLIADSPAMVKAEFQDLLQDIPITKRIDENIVFDDLTKDDITIYSFLLFSGYLKAFEGEDIDGDTYYNLLIPNKEVKQIFKHVISKWIDQSYENRKLNMMLEALTSNDIKIFERILSDFVVETLSYFDTQKRDVERVYQAFILGLLVNLSPQYEINSNKESGYGRYDVAIIPKDKTKRAIIMELKKIDKLEEETKDSALESALQQIEDKKYESDISKRGIEDITKLAVTFDGKRVWVKTAE